MIIIMIIIIVIIIIIIIIILILIWIIMRDNHDYCDEGDDGNRGDFLGNLCSGHTPLSRTSPPARDQQRRPLALVHACDPFCIPHLVVIMRSYQHSKSTQEKPALPRALPQPLSALSSVTLCKGCFLDLVPSVSPVVVTV